MAYLLRSLKRKKEIDQVIQETKDKVVVLRFGKSKDKICMKMDDILSRCEIDLSKMASLYIIETSTSPVYCHYFDITLIPATVFFFNAKHIKVDYGTPDHTKFIGSFYTKQDCIDLIEVIYRGAKRGKTIVTCPIDPSRITKYLSGLFLYLKSRPISSGKKFHDSIEILLINGYSHPL